MAATTQVQLLVGTFFCVSALIDLCMHAIARGMKRSEEVLGMPAVKLANLSVKKLHVFPIPAVSSQEDLQRLIGCNVKPQVDLRALLEVNKKPTPSSIQSAVSLPTICPCDLSPAEQQAVMSHSFELPIGYISKSFSTCTYDLLDLRADDMKLLAQINELQSLSEQEYITIIYRWDVESVKSSVSSQIGQEMAKVISSNALTRDLLPAAFQLLYNHWTSQWDLNENRPLSRAVWAYQQDILLEKAHLCSSHPKAARHTRGRRKSSFVANR